MKEVDDALSVLEKLLPTVQPFVDLVPKLRTVNAMADQLGQLALLKQQAEVDLVTAQTNLSVISNKLLVVHDDYSLKTSQLESDFQVLSTDLQNKVDGLNSAIESSKTAYKTLNDEQQAAFVIAEQDRNNKIVALETMITQHRSELSNIMSQITAVGDAVNSVHVSGG